MNDITANEIRVALRIAKDFTTPYNANNLSKELGLSAMGVLKIVNKLQDQGILVAKTIGKANILSINYDNDYAQQFLSFLLRKEAEEALPRIKRWASELRKLEATAEIAVLFGSVLAQDKHNDIDLLVVLNQRQDKPFDRELEAINRLSAKNVNPVKQTMQDFKENLKRKDAVLMSAVKRGIVLFGHKEYVKVLAHATR